MFGEVQQGQARKSDFFCLDEGKPLKVFVQEHILIRSVVQKNYY